MSKIAMNVDHRLVRRQEAKLHLKQSRYTGIRPIVGKYAKPPVYTIIRANTARAFRWLEARGLADFTKCRLAVAMKRVLTTFGVIHDLRGCKTYASA